MSNSNCLIENNNNDLSLTATPTIIEYFLLEYNCSDLATKQLLYSIFVVPTEGISYMYTYIPLPFLNLPPNSLIPPI